MVVKKIGVAKFKENCLSLLNKLEPEGLVVTKHGKPVARVIPFPDTPAKLIGSLKKQLVIHGDVMSTNVEWNSSAES